MTRYVHAPNGKVETYPYSHAQLRRDNPNVSFPAEAGDWLAEYHVFPVLDTAPPSPPIDKNLLEATPVFSDGAWRQTWTLQDGTAEQIARRTEQAAQASELETAKLDAWIIQFLAMTPSGAQDYINNNSATLASLRTNVARLAYAVRLLVRKELNR